MFKSYQEMRDAIGSAASKAAEEAWLLTMRQTEPVYIYYRVAIAGENIGKVCASTTAIEGWELLTTEKVSCAMTQGMIFSWILRLLDNKPIIGGT